MSDKIPSPAEWAASLKHPAGRTCTTCSAASKDPELAAWLGSSMEGKFSGKLRFSLTQWWRQVNILFPKCKLTQVMLEGHWRHWSKQQSLTRKQAGS